MGRADDTKYRECASPPSSPDSLDVPLFTTRALKITVVQDPSCCWCFVGRQEMKKALEMLRRRDDVGEFSVSWEFKPWIVYPSLPAENPVDRVTWSVQKHGANAFTAEQVLKQRCSESGIKLKPGPLRCPMLCNRLVKRAHQIGGGTAQMALMEEIERRIFEEGEDVGCLSVLSDCAASTGLMCREQAIAFLTSEKLYQEVVQEIISARKCGVIGVPFVVLNEKWAVSGGQPAETYMSAFMQALSNESAS